MVFCLKCASYFRRRPGRSNDIRGLYFAHATADVDASVDVIYYMSQQSWTDLNSTNSPHLTIAAIHDTRDTETISLTTGHFHNIRGTSSYADRHAHLSRARLWLHVSPPTPALHTTPISFKSNQLDPQNRLITGSSHAR